MTRILVHILGWTSVTIMIVIALGSCRKSASGNPFGNQKIATVDFYDNDVVQHYHIFYDAYNNVDSIAVIGGGIDTNSNGYLKFVYSGSNYTITDESNATLLVETNASGNIIEIAQVDTFTVKYNGSQVSEISQVLLTSPPTSSYIDEYFDWTNGDVASSRENNTYSYWTYNMSRPGQPGDPQRIRDFLQYGRSIFKTAHLPASFTGTSQGTNFSYSFDASGRISTLVLAITDATLATIDSEIYHYTYY